MWPDEYLCYEYGIVNVLYNIENIEQGKPKKNQQATQQQE